MQENNSLNIYFKYRRLLVLILIFPIYKLFDALLDGDVALMVIMLASIIFGVVCILYIEVLIKKMKKV